MESSIKKISKIADAPYFVRQPRSIPESPPKARIAGWRKTHWRIQFYSDAPLRYRSLNQVHRGLCRILKIVRNLLTFARKRHTTRAMIDVNEVVRQTLALRSYEQRVTNISVLDALAAGLPTVFADAHQIQQVLLNLIRNAMDAMEAAPRRDLVVSVVPTGDGHVRISVADTGSGIAPEIADQLFTPFITTKRQGMGVGLSISRTIVEAHGGRIWVEPNPGGGTIFHFTLEVVEEEDVDDAA